MSDVQNEPDYDGLAAWVTVEMERQSLQPSDIAKRGGPSWPTLREILAGTARERRPAILRHLSEALGYPPDTAARILNRQPLEPGAAQDGRIRAVEDRLDELARELVQIRQHLQDQPGRNANGVH